MRRVLGRLRAQPLPVDEPSPAPAPPPPPPPPDDETHLRLEAALRDLPGLFDPDWYVQQLTEELEPAADLLEHFMRSGRALNLSPGPWLDSLWYWSEYPDVELAGQAAVDHYLLHGEAEGRPPRADFVPRLTILTPKTEYRPLELTAQAWQFWPDQHDTADPGWILDDLADARVIEPQLAMIQGPSLVRMIPSTHRSAVTDCVNRVLDALVADSFLILVPHFLFGGADRVAANLARVAADELGPENVFVISTDRGASEAMSWFPRDVTLRRMQITKDNELGHEASGWAMAELLMNACPRTVVNINSLSTWRAMQDFGPTLARHMSLNVTQFCRDMVPDGGMTGYADAFLRDTIESLDRVLLDHRGFGQDLIRDLGLLPRDSEKLRVLYSPATTPISDRDLTGRDTRRVLWVGRLVDQKRPELVAEIASSMPDLTFDMYGGPVTDEVIDTYGLDVPNIELHGPVSSMTALNPRDYGALLFTSRYEGMPVTVVDVGAWGLPVVASEVGGLPELVDSSTGWPLPDDAPAEDYVHALTEALDPHEGARRGLALRQRVGVQHSWEQFRQSVIASGLLGRDLP